MNIDEYLNELQSNLDNQLARFGMGEQLAGNADNTEATEEKKFCPECGKQVAIYNKEKKKTGGRKSHLTRKMMTNT